MAIFAHPERLRLAIVLIPMAIWLLRGSRLRSREWKELGQPGRPASDGSWGWLAAMALVIVAIGQPRWGRILGHDAPPGHDVVVVIDVSRSMGAEDAVPNRLGVAIESASSLIEALEAGAGNRAAVVAFAGRGVVRCPLTSSLGSAAEIVRSLKVGEIEPGGTDLGSALEAALGAFDDEEHAEGRAIVVFSDGEDHVGAWSSILARLREARTIVHALAIGDAEKSSPVPSASPAIEKESRPETRRSDLAPRELAKATSGAFIPLGLAPADLGSLYRDRIEPAARSRRDSLRLPERVERFPGFLLAAVVCGLAASWRGGIRRRGRRIPKVAAMAAVALVLIGVGASKESPASLVEEGRKAYTQGRFEEALNAFERATKLEPAAAITHYDVASALFQLCRFPEAIARYEEARKTADPGLSTKIDYALGNARLAVGDLTGALSSYDECQASTHPGAVFDAVREDARLNREFVAKRLPPQSEKPDDGAKSPGSKRPAPRAGESGDDADKGETSTNPTGSSMPNPQAETGNQGGSRGSGGAGGSGQAPPADGSPGSRLDSALKNLKDARSQRPPESRGSGSKSGGKDW